jgi:hypothetical protein
MQSAKGWQDCVIVTCIILSFELYESLHSFELQVLMRISAAASAIDDQLWVVFPLDDIYQHFGNR